MLRFLKYQRFTPSGCICKDIERENLSFCKHVLNLHRIRVIESNGLFMFAMAALLYSVSIGIIDEKDLRDDCTEICH